MQKVAKRAPKDTFIMRQSSEIKVVSLTNIQEKFEDGSKSKSKITSINSYFTAFY